MWGYIWGYITLAQIKNLASMRVAEVSVRALMAPHISSDRFKAFRAFLCLLHMEITGARSLAGAADAPGHTCAGQNGYHFM
jgi:hypothetical protein